MIPPYASDWETVALGKIAKLRLGRTPARAEDRYWKDGSVPWVAISDLNNRVVRTTKESISAEAHKEVFRAELVPEGTLLMSFKLTIGKIGILDTPAVHNEAIVSFDIDECQVDRDYLAFVLQDFDYEAHLDAYVKGRTLNKGKLEKLPIPIPSLEEQRHIAQVLRAAQESRIATEDVVTAARGLKTSLMHHLFSVGVVPADQAGFVQTTETEFGKVPSHWCIRKLSDCAHVQTGVAKGRKLKNRESVEVPYLRVANVQDGYLDLSEIKTITIGAHELERYQLQYDDVVVTEGGDFDKLGRGFIWRGQVPGAVHQNHVFAVRADRSIVDPEFLSYVVQSRYAKSYFLKVAHRTTNLASINSTKLKAFPMLIPPMSEQRQIVEILKVIDEKIKAETKHAESIQTLFDSLLSQLMSGRLRVSEAIHVDPELGGS